jgi:hypothetical protein
MLNIPTPIKATLFALGAASVLSLAACNDDPASNDQASVTMQGQLESSAVSLAKATSGTGAIVDSLHVTKMRVFVRRLKLHVDKSDTVVGDKEVKTDPFVITFQGTATTFANFSIPAGTYDKVKFEFHRPEESQVATYLNIADFVDFVTSGRYSVIYEGSLYTGGSATAVPFVYKSDMTANLSINFDTPVALDAGSTSTVVLQIDPADVFKKGGAVLDPRDASNESEIDNNIKAAIHLHKH